MIAELLVNLPGQTKGNIGQIVHQENGFITLKMIDRSIVTLTEKDVIILD